MMAVVMGYRSSFSGVFQPQSISTRHKDQTVSFLFSEPYEIKTKRSRLGSNPSTYGAFQQFSGFGMLFAKAQGEDRRALNAWQAQFHGRVSYEALTSLDTRMGLARSHRLIGFGKWTNTP
jgi:hypothetical protein